MDPDRSSVLITIFVGVLIYSGASAQASANQTPPAAHTTETAVTPPPNWRLEVAHLDRQLAAALEKEIQRLEAESGKDVYVWIDRGKIRRLLSPALAPIFSDYVFIRVPFELKERLHAIGQTDCPSGLSRTVAIHMKTGRTFAFPGPPVESFALLLAEERVTLKNQEDADRIWQAFCAIHQHRWFGGKHVIVDSRTWRLNREVKEETSGNKEVQREYFYEVVTNSDGIVIDGRLRSLPP